MFETHGEDTQHRVCFYERDFYVLSNFSAFDLCFDGTAFPTSEHAYQAQKFVEGQRGIFQQIRLARSAHQAFKIAELNKPLVRLGWDSMKCDVMRQILFAKADQHEYVRRKLLATGDRELVEDSWRDAYWGWGLKRDGMNMLGRLWMEVRDELRRVSREGGSV